MQKRGYFNVILTVNAVLLAALVWTQVSSAPLGRAAHAEPMLDIPNAGAQRLEMLRELQLLRAQLTVMAEFLDEGELKVRVVQE